MGYSTTQVGSQGSLPGYRLVPAWQLPQEVAQSRRRTPWLSGKPEVAQRINIQARSLRKEYEACRHPKDPVSESHLSFFLAFYSLVGQEHIQPDYKTGSQ